MPDRWSIPARTSVPAVNETEREGPADLGYRAVLPRTMWEALAQESPPIVRGTAAQACEAMAQARRETNQARTARGTELCIAIALYSRAIQKAYEEWRAA